MTTPNREQHKNFGNTTLNGSIINSDTSIVVTDGSVFPSVGNFHVMIDSEIIKITARSTNTLTAVRAQEGTTGASHSNTAVVSMIYSVGGISQIFQDNNALFGLSTFTPVNLLVADDGKTVLTSSDFTWQNQGGATVSDSGGSVVMACPTDTGRNIRVQERSAPSTPYTYIGAFQCLCALQDGDAKPSFGMGFRESSSGKLMLQSFLSESFFGPFLAVAISRFSDTSSLFTTNDGPRKLVLFSDIFWVKIENDGTNLKWYLSFDGTSWLLYFSESKTAYFSGNPDKVLWWGGNLVNSGAPATEMHVRLLHWSKGE